MANKYSKSGSGFWGTLGKGINAFFDSLGVVFSVIPWRAIFTIMAVAALVFALVVPLAKYVSRDREGPLYEDLELSFSYGNIDDKGNVVNVRNALYTKDMIPCEGFRVKLAYGAAYYYEVHYFTEDDRWLSSEKVEVSGLYDVDVDDFPEDAAGIRIVLVRIDGMALNWLSKSRADNCLILDVYRTSANLDDAESGAVSGAGSAATS